MSTLIQIESQDAVLTIRMNRPDKKNALTGEMYRAIAQAFKDAASDPKTRAVLLTGSGDAFTSGNDLQDFIKAPANESFEASALGQFMLSLATFPKPVVAAVNGLAIGIGVTMLLHCDLIYAAQGTRMQLPFTNLGTCPEFGSSFLLPRIMGNARAAELLLLGEPFTAEKALEYGLVNAVLPSDRLVQHARERAAKLASQPPQAVRTSKELLRRWSRDAALSAAKVEIEQFMAMLRQPEAVEAIAAFTQKRKPDFSRFE